MSAQLTLFPLQYQRQEAVPIDKDTVFNTTAERIAYLTSPRRYSGQIASDLEQEGKLYILSNDRSSWKLISGDPVVPLWGTIQGNIYNQTDLIDLINSNTLSVIQVTYSDLESDHKTYTNVSLAGKNYIIFQAAINGFLTSPEYVTYIPTGGFELSNEMIEGDLLYLFGESFAYVFPEGISEVYNALDRTSAGAVLDARQGKILNDKLQEIGGLKINENTPVAANEAAALALQLEPYTLYITSSGEVRYKLPNGVVPNAPTNGIVDNENDTFTFTGGTI